MKIEAECFHYGGVWNAQRMVQKGLLSTPVWITFFLGWRGGSYTPPTAEAMLFNHHHLPPGFLYNTSVMDPAEQWKILTVAIILGGHVRVGMEDNPFVARAQYARSNAELVEKIVRIARELGREVATPLEARQMIWPSEASVPMARINAVSFHEYPSIESICRAVRAAGFDSIELSRPGSTTS